jgi:hypothetical protein
VTGGFSIIFSGPGGLGDTHPGLPWSSRVSMSGLGAIPPFLPTGSYLQYPNSYPTSRDPANPLSMMIKRGAVDQKSTAD